MSVLLCVLGGGVLACGALLIVGALARPARTRSDAFEASITAGLGGVAAIVGLGVISLAVDL